jgi:hypothetical protein
MAMTARAGRGKPWSMSSSFVSLDRLVQGGQVTAGEAGRVQFLWDEIRRLKREKNAFIPAHNYQVPEVQAIADVVGDSFELAVRARDIAADRVILREDFGANSGFADYPTLGVDANAVEIGFNNFTNGTS